MKRQVCKRSILIAASALCLLFAAPVCSRAAKEPWTSVRSPNFFLVGNASEREIRGVATHLEKFRETFTRLLARDHFDSSVPTTVLVFRDESTYRPFKPLYRGRPADIAGYFQSSPEVDYITISLDQQSGRQPYSLIYHEYVHLLIKNNFRRAPAWLHEGLAEYYSTFNISKDNRKVTIGKPIANRVLFLRNHSLLPLQTLFAVDRYSPYYNEQDQRGIFYAQSWALVHYLLNGKGGQRQSQFSRFIELLTSGETVEDSFQQAFQTDFTTIESELRAYLRNARYPEQVRMFDQRLEFQLEAQSAPVTEAETRAYLGDLLLHTDRLDEAESYLQRAIAADPNLSMAYASLGLLRLKQNHFSEARQHLERAIALNPKSYLAHYYYADVLSRDGTETDTTVKGYAERTRLIRAELKKAIELAPGFLESYRLLALADLERNPQLDETLALINHVLHLTPRRQEFLLLLARVHLRQEEFSVARKLLEAVKHNSTEPQLRTEAQTLLDRVAASEQAAALLKSQNAGIDPESTSQAATQQPCDMPQPGPQLKPLRFNGAQACGRLVKIECAETGVVLLVEAGDQTLKFHSEKLNGIRFVTYSSDMRGRIECGGLSTPAPPVLVTYRSAKNKPADFAGEVVAVEFVPEDWDH